MIGLRVTAASRVLRMLVYIFIHIYRYSRQGQTTARLATYYIVKVFLTLVNLYLQIPSTAYRSIYRAEKSCTSDYFLLS